MSSLMSNSRFCGGNVKPARFVTQDTAVQGRVVQSTDGAGAHGDKPFGISDRSTWQPPLGVVGGATALDDGFAGTVNSPPITVWMEGSECLILSGAAFAIDDELKADVDGRGIVGIVAGDFIGAVALEAATAANQLRKVRVIRRQKVA
jgi:hypothetical protein